MKSPFADCEAHLVQEPRTTFFRGEVYHYLYSYYECDKTKQPFTTTALDEENVQQVYNQYRTKYGIPSAQEISSLKEQYGLSSTQLSLLLGFDKNLIDDYIEGEIPTLENGKILSSIKNPEVFNQYLQGIKSVK